MPQGSIDVTARIIPDTSLLAQQLRSLERSGALNFSPKLDGQGFSAPLGRITGDVGKFESSLSAANQRVITFGASVGIIYGTVRAFRDLVGSVIEVDKALKQLNAIYGLSQSQLQKFSEGLFNVARQTGQTFKITAEAATEFSRQGLSAAETLKRTRDALILVRLSGLDTGEAVQQLTAILNGFNKTGYDSTTVINKLTAVDQSYAVSARDLVGALSRVGSVAQQAGTSFEQMLGLVTAAKQITGRDGPLIGNALSTIFTRLGRSTTMDQLNQLGVATKDLAGNLRPAYDVLKDLAVAYQGFTQQQQNQVAQLAAGVFRVNQFKALMTDLAHVEGIAAQATQTASNARDTAIQRNAAYNQSISALATNLGTSIKEISADFGQLAFGNFLKGGLNFGQKIADVLKPDSEKGGESVGRFFGEGIAKGIGNVLTGPVLGIALAVLAKIIASTGKTLIGDISKQLNFNQISVKEAELQTGINALIAKGTQAEQARFLATSNTVRQEEILVGILNRQIQAYTALGARGAALGEQLALSGEATAIQQVGRRIMKTGRFAGGYIPGAIGAESNAIAQGVGGATSSAKPVVISDFNFGGGQRGAIVANTSEYLVPHFAGGSAIFNREMINKYGIPPGAKPIAAEGYIPNFAGGFGGRNPVSGRFMSASERRLIEIINTGKNPLTGRFVSALERESAENQLLNILFEQEFARNTISSSQVFGGRRISIAETKRRINAAQRSAIIPYEQEFATVAPSFERSNISESLAQEADRLEKEFYRNIKRKALSPQNNLIDKYRKQQNILAREAKFRNIALGGAFIAPFVGGFVEPTANAFGINTGGGTTGGKITGGVSGALQGVGIGGLFGPEGAVAGAIIGGFIGLLGKATKSLEEFAKETENINNQRGSEVETINKVQAAYANFIQAQKSGDVKETLAYQKEYTSALKQLPLNSPVIAALKSGNIEQLGKVSEEEISKLVNAQTASNVALQLRDGVTDNKSLVGGFASILQGGKIGREDVEKAFAFANESNLPQIRTTVGPYGTTVQSESDIKKQQAYAAAFSSFLGKFNKELEGVTIPFNSISKASFALVSAMQQVRQAEELEAKAKKDAAKPGLSEEAFLSNAPLQSLNQLASLSKFPFAGGRLISREQRGNVEYNAIEELIKSADVKPENLQAVSPELYNRRQTSRYYNQRGNLLNTATEFLTNSLNLPRYQYYNPSTRNFNEQNIIGSLTRLKGGPNQTLAPEADFLLKQITALGNTQYNLSQNPNTARGVLGGALAGSINGIQVGSPSVGYAGTDPVMETNRKMVKDLQDILTKTQNTVMKVVIDVSGNVNLLAGNATETHNVEEFKKDVAAAFEKYYGEILEAKRAVAKLQKNPLPPTQPSKNIIRPGNNTSSKTFLPFIGAFVEPQSSSLPSSNTPTQNDKGFYTIKH